MKKKILISLLTLVIVVGIIVVVVIMRVNTIVASFKPQIEAIVSQSLKSPVAIAGIDASLFPSATVSLRDVTLGEPGTDQTRVGSVAASVDLLPLLRSSLNVSAITITGLDIGIARETGGIRVRGLPTPPPEALPASKTPPQPTGTPETRTSSDKTAARGSALPLSLNFSRLSLSDSTVHFHDALSRQDVAFTNLTIESGLTYQGSQAHIKSFSLSTQMNGSIPITLVGSDLHFDTMSFDSTIGSFRWEAPGITGAVTGQLNAKSLHGTFSTKEVSLELAALPKYLPQLKALNLGGNITSAVSGTLNGPRSIVAEGEIRLASLAATAPKAAIADMNGVITIKTIADPTPRASASSPTITLSLNQKPVTIAFATEATGNRVSLSKMEATVAGGTVTVSGELASNHSFSSRVNASSLRLDELVALAQAPVPIKPTGTLSSFNADIQGVVGSQLLSSVNGPISLELRETSLEGMNILQDVFKEIRSLPFVQAAEEKFVPSALKEALNASSTPINRLRARSSLSAGVATIQDLLFESTFFSLTGAGSIDIVRAHLDVGTSFSLTQSISSALVDRSPNLRYGLDDKGQLTLPVRLTGTPPKLLVYPDVKKLLSEGGKQALKEKASDLLGKVIKDSPQAGKTTTGKQKLKEGLRGLLGGL